MVAIIKKRKKGIFQRNIFIFLKEGSLVSSYVYILRFFFFSPFQTACRRSCLWVAFKLQFLTFLLMYFFEVSFWRVFFLRRDNAILYNLNRESSFENVSHSWHIFDEWYEPKKLTFSKNIDLLFLNRNNQHNNILNLESQCQYVRVIQILSSNDHYNFVISKCMIYPNFERPTVAPSQNHW